jgi:hypothetical protein
MEFFLRSNSAKYRKIVVLVIAFTCAFLTGCGDFDSKVNKNGSDDSQEAYSNQAPLNERQAINLLPSESELQKLPYLARFASSSYSSEVGTEVSFRVSAGSEFDSKPYSCLPVPLLVFFGQAAEVNGSLVDGKIEKVFNVTFKKTGKEVLLVYIIKPIEASSKVAFDSYLTDFSECARFAWSFQRGYSEGYLDNVFPRLMQDARSTITQSTKNSFKGNLKSEVIYPGDNCPDFKCFANWNSTFILKQIPGYILMGTLLNTTGPNERRKAPDVSPDDVADLDKVLINLEDKILKR